MLGKELVLNLVQAFRRAIQSGRHSHLHPSPQVFQTQGIYLEHTNETKGQFSHQHLFPQHIFKARQKWALVNKIIHHLLHTTKLAMTIYGGTGIGTWSLASRWNLTSAPCTTNSLDLGLPIYNDEFMLKLVCHALRSALIKNEATLTQTWIQCCRKWELVHPAL